MSDAAIRMSKGIPVQGLSLGHALDTVAPGNGMVHSVFEHAVNLVVGGEMWTLLASRKRDLPFGIRVACAGFGPLGIQRGDNVNVRAGFLSIASHLVIDCRTAEYWQPSFPAAPASGIFTRLEAVASAAHARAWHCSAEMARSVVSAIHHPSALRHELAKVVGAGPGATPSGDDVLVGILAVLNSPYSGGLGEQCAARLRNAIEPLLATTTDVSAHLLRQSAHGFVGRDLHELLVALACGTSAAQLQSAIQNVIETGATSGADACTGTIVAAKSFLIPQHERAAA